MFYVKHFNNLLFWKWFLTSNFSKFFPHLCLYFFNLLMGAIFEWNLKCGAVYTRMPSFLRFDSKVSSLVDLPFDFSPLYQIKNFGKGNLNKRIKGHLIHYAVGIFFQLVSEMNFYWFLSQESYTFQSWWQN